MTAVKSGGLPGALQAVWLYKDRFLPYTLEAFALNFSGMKQFDFCGLP